MSTSTRSSALALALVLCAPRFAAADEVAPPAASNALDPLRERFREGMEKYRAGAFAEAIVIWEAIYAELGAEKGYRLAFNLGRAYDQFGDTTRAAERYEAYGKEARAREAAGEALEPLVGKQLAEAEERLAELTATKGRLRIVTDRTLALRIDGGVTRLASRGFLAYVTPGRHVLTFEPNEPGSRSVEVTIEAGALRDVTAPEIAAPPPPPPVTYELRREPPFPRAILWASAGAAVLSTAVPLALFAEASGTKGDFYAARAALPYDAARANALRSSYADQKDASYVTWAIPAALGAATLALAAYWLWGGKQHRVPITAGTF